MTTEQDYKKAYSLERLQTATRIFLRQRRGAGGESKDVECLIKGPYLLRKHDSKEHCNVGTTWVDSDSDDNYHPYQDRPSRKRKRAAKCARASNKRAKNAGIEASVEIDTGFTEILSFAEQDTLVLQHGPRGDRSDSTELVHPNALDKEERPRSVDPAEDDLRFSQFDEKLGC